MFSLLRRIAVALERQAEHSEEIRNAYRTRATLDAQDRIAADTRIREAEEYAERMQQTARQTAKEYAERQDEHARKILENQQAVIVQNSEVAKKYYEVLKKYEDHIAKCEAWHRQVALASGDAVAPEKVN